MHDYRTIKITNLLSYYYQNKLLNIAKKSMKGPVKICFGQSKNQSEVLNKLKSRGFRASSLSSYNFSTLYSTLPKNLIKDKLVDFN